MTDPSKPAALEAKKAPVPKAGTEASDPPLSSQDNHPRATPPTKDAPLTKALFTRRSLAFVPPHLFSHSATLTVLNLSFNELKEVPAILARLTELRQLRLPGNKIRKVSKRIGSLTKLELLDLSHNHLSGLPLELHTLVALKTLRIEYNRLQFLPLALCTLVRLTHLYLNGNVFMRTVHDEIKRLVNLKTLELDLCSLTQVPDSLNRLIQLESISLAQNCLKDLPDSLRQLKKLKEWNLAYNQFASLPDWLTKNSSITTLITHGNLSTVMSFPDWRVGVKESGPSKILDGLFLGDLEDAKNKNFLKANNVTHILGVLDMFCYFYPEDFMYKIIPVPDIPSTTLADHFEVCFKFIQEAISSGGGVLVHCFAGVSRSATIVTSYVMKSEGLRSDEALRFVSQRRKIIFPNWGFQEQLRQYSDELSNPRIDACSVS